MKVFSIIGNKKMCDSSAPEILQGLESEGYSVGFIKKADHISSNSRTKNAVIWGERQSLHYHEGAQTIHDLLKLFDEDYIIVDGDEKSNIPKLLFYEEVDLESTTDVGEIGSMNALKRRDDIFFTAKKDTDNSEIVKAIKDKVYDILPDKEPGSCDICGKTCKELGVAIIKGEALREDCKIDNEPVEIVAGEKKLDADPLVKKILRNTMEAVTSELDGYEEDADITVTIRK